MSSISFLSTLPLNRQTKTTISWQGQYNYEAYRINGKLLSVEVLILNIIRWFLISRVLLTERKTLKSNSPLTDRLIARAMAVHTAD
jgi:hypothetical protein